MPHDRAVYIIDDDNAVRHSLRFLLESVKLPCVAYASADEFLAALEAGLEAPAACAIVDVRMPGISGLELQQRLILKRSAIPLILVTGHGDIPMAVNAMKSGAFGFLTKPYKDQELLDLVHAAMASESESRQRADFASRCRACVGQLTPREAEVMEFVVQGLGNKQIAATLNVAEKTVETHRANVMRKMDADSIAQLVRMSLAAAA
jgi:FixJ family two-component response regulator